MNLKTSYRYANYLDNLLNTAYAYLSDNTFTITYKQKHLRRKANSEAEDETLMVPKTFDVDFTPMNVIDFAVKIIAEREALTEAVAAAKAKAEINIDNAISMNQRKQKFVGVLNGLAHFRPNTRIIQGFGYKLNAEGNQTKYYYDIEETASIDYDRSDVRALIKKYNKNCDAVSEQLDAIEINTMVDFDPQWDVNDNFEDALASFLTEQS